MSTNGQPSPGVKVEVTIKLMANGQIHVTGPLADKVAMYGLLELAKDVVRLQEVAEAPRIAPVTMMPKFGN